VAFTSWNLALGLAILSDTRSSKIFPRWLGYYNIFVGLSFLPDLLVPFFKTGGSTGEASSRTGSRSRSMASGSWS
jgi:hypothetical protein